MGVVVLLGPQRFTPTLGEAVAAAGVGGRLASVTAGWQEREAEDLELHEHLGERTVNLMLYARGEDVFARDPALFRAHRERQERLREQQELYRTRLVPMREAARRLLAAEGEESLLAPERDDALRALARLDAHHLGRVAAIDQEFESAWRPSERPAVRRHGAAIDRQIERVEALAVAGGHVAVLLNRLRLFGLAARLSGRALFAWSAGAMAACERIVLFHDSPPQGQGVPEVLESGLGLVRGAIALPHARRRLRLEDRARVALFARRFAPDRVLAFEDGGRLLLRDGAMADARGVLRLGEDGGVAPLEVA
jgi:hypothetical protein